MIYSLIIRYQKLQKWMARDWYLPSSWHKIVPHLIKKDMGLSERAIRSIEDVSNPLLNSINEKCSRIRAIFQGEVDASLLDQYIIIGKSGEAKKIALPRDLVIWE